MLLLTPNLFKEINEDTGRDKLSLFYLHLYFIFLKYDFLISVLRLNNGNS